MSTGAPEDKVLAIYPCEELLPTDLHRKLTDGRLTGLPDVSKSSFLESASRDLEAALDRLSTDDFGAIEVDGKDGQAIESVTLMITLSLMEQEGLDLHRCKHLPSATLTEFTQQIISAIALSGPGERPAIKTRRQRLIARSVSLLDGVSNKTTEFQVWLEARSGADDTRMG